MILAIFLKYLEILKFGMGLRVFMWLKWKGFHGLVHVHVEPLKSIAGDQVGWISCNCPENRHST